MDTPPATPAPAPAPVAIARPTEPPHNVLAWVSLGLGCAFVLFGTLASIAAVVCGHIARRQIRQRGEQGDSAAVWGLVLGYFGIAISVLLVGFFVLLFAGAFVLAGVGQQL